MPIFSTFQRCSFNGVAFPTNEIDVEGGIRDHIHEYPHAAGGAPEKLGRKLYVFRIVGNFQATFPAYPNLYPYSLATLRSNFEAQNTAELVVPTIGRIQAYCRSWKQSASGKMLSGEIVEMEFVEDQSNEFLLVSFTSSDTASFAAKMEVLKQVLDESPPPVGLAPEAVIGSVTNQVLAPIRQAQAQFDSLLSAAQAAQTAINDVTSTPRSVLASLEGVIAFAAQCDANPVSKNPANAALIAALHDVWFSAVQQKNNLQSQQVPLKQYRVPVTCAVSDVAKTLYGDASRASDLMDINAIIDAFSIPAGTTLNYYPVSTAA